MKPRVLTLLDLSQIVIIENAVQTVPWAGEIFEKCLQAGSCGWVIEDVTSKLIGFILVLVQTDECHILNLGVVLEQQRQGYGSRLLSHALTEVKQRGVKMTYLEVRRSNENAIMLYKKMGFEKIGERKNYYAAAKGREDAWVFAKIL